MNPLWIVLIVFGALAVLLFAAAYLGMCLACLHCRAFVSNIDRFLDRPAYRPYAERIRAGRAWIDAQESHLMTCLSYDGLTLAARFFPCENARATLLLFHGWRSEGAMDFSCACEFYRSLGLNLLLVDQRAQGASAGRYMTYGVRERHDVHSWVRTVNEHLGTELPVLLGGLSMGATTVLMATGEPLPENVCGVIADCGFTSPKAILTKVLRDKHLPPRLILPFVGVQMRLFAGFSPDEYSAQEALRQCRLPVFFAHGEADAFVPCEMSRENFSACASSDKTLLLVPDAGHGKSFLMAQEEYSRQVSQFVDRALAKHNKL